MCTVSLLKTILAVVLFSSSFGKGPVLRLHPRSQLVELITDKEPTISVQWDKIVQKIVIETEVGPTVASCAYAQMHTAMFDAWSVFDEQATSTSGKFYKIFKKGNINKMKEKSMSFGAFQILKTVFPDKEDYLIEMMDRMGYFPRDDNTEEVLIAKELADIILKRYSISNPTDEVENLYQEAPFTNSVDRWTAEHVPIEDVTGPYQKFLTPEWGRKFTFGVKNGKSGRPPPPKPFLLQDGTVDVEEKKIKLNNGTEMMVSRELIGTIINPAFIEQAEIVLEHSRNLTDETKLIAEFWEDGGGTSFPPGTWMTFGQYVSARDGNDLDTDAKLFLALANAVSDAGITSWNAKLFYYYCRPVRAIRDLGKLGLIGEYDKKMDGFAITAYSPSKMKVSRHLVKDWQTYQTPGSHPSPPFAEYTSGHSAFSSSAAEVLKQFTGSDYFGASITFRHGESRFEPGHTPMEDHALSWKTFTEAADQAGDSRLYGGIHFTDGNDNGKNLGRLVGLQAFKKAESYFFGNTTQKSKYQVAME